MPCTSGACNRRRIEQPIFIGVSPYSEDWLRESPSEPEVVQPARQQATVFNARPNGTNVVNASGPVQRGPRL